MSDLKLCYGCMEPLGSDSVCAHCGYDQNSTSLANYLKPGTVLHERYLVGKMLAANGEGVTYIGYDKTVDCKLLIREYFPERLCSRVTNGTAVNVKYDHLAQALMAEYTPEQGARTAAQSQPPEPCARTVHGEQHHLCGL